MAKDVNIQFSGSIGPLVGCLRDGKYHYRSKPAQVRQTKATKLSSNNFGLASKAGKIMRLYLATSIPDAKNRHMHKRLATSIGNWLGLLKGLPPQPTTDIPFVNHFNFSPEVLLKEKLKIVPEFKQAGPNLATLQIPAFVPVTSVKASAGTTHIQLCIGAVALRLGSDGWHGNSNHTITIPYNDSLQYAQQVDLPLQTQPGNILIAALQIRFGIQQAGEINYRKFEGKHVAGIVGAVYL
jgi:hypothetical protein